MCTQSSVSALSALVLGLALGLPTTTQAQIADLQTQSIMLRQAVCAHEWEEAIALVDQMVVSPNISNADQDMLLEYRTLLVGWEANDDGTLQVMGCGSGSLSSDRWERAVVMVQTMRPYWSGYCPGRAPYDYELLGSGSSSSSGSSGSSSGNCENPGDRAADGSICGDRAASVRPGGR